MRACNTNIIHNPSLHPLVSGLRMLLLLHALIPCVAAYQVTHIIIVECPHPLSCCIYAALVSLLYGTVIPTSFNILMEIYTCFADFFRCILASKYNTLCMCASPTTSFIHPRGILGHVPKRSYIYSYSCRVREL